MPSTNAEASQGEEVPYGGKLSFKARDERNADIGRYPTMPTSPVPRSEPPRVLNDPTYSEGSSG